MVTGGSHGSEWDRSLATVKQQLLLGAVCLETPAGRTSGSPLRRDAEQWGGCCCCCRRRHDGTDNHTSGSVFNFQVLRWRGKGKNQKWEEINLRSLSAFFYINSAPHPDAYGTGYKIPASAVGRAEDKYIWMNKQGK